MAGHSQFKNIMHRKGKQDAARAKLFAKLAREITVAAKTGLPDPEMNARLRLAIQNARAENMPKDNIERAIKKAAGRRCRELRRDPLRGLRSRRRRHHHRGADRQPQSHGRRSPRGVHQVRRQPRRDRRGRRTCSAGSARSSTRPRRASADAVLEAAIDAGADDVVSDESGHVIVVRLRAYGRGRRGAGSQARRGAIVKAVWKPVTTTPVDEDNAGTRSSS